MVTTTTTTTTTTKHTSQKIAVLTLGYWNVGDLDACLTSLEAQVFSESTSASASTMTSRKGGHGMLDIFVLENPTPWSEKVAEMVRSHRRVKKQLLSTQNVHSHLWRLFLRDNGKDVYEEYEYIALSDGDVVLSDPHSVDEARRLLRIAGSKAFVCSVDVDLSNDALVDKQIDPSLLNSIPPSITIRYLNELEGGEEEEFVVGPTGLQFVMFRSEELRSFVEAVDRNEVGLLVGYGGDTAFRGISDATLREYVWTQKRSWIRTKRTKLTPVGWFHTATPPPSPQNLTTTTLVSSDAEKDANEDEEEVVVDVVKEGEMKALEMRRRDSEGWKRNIDDIYDSELQLRCLLDRIFF
eukprot:TRINITY_DN6429_c0_g2_i1.p1 TRINITY_DN6429_c0_g2~~TRINITY_DN6429_c0_g2_i1.p1  ORF type:complete len:353 (+),score=86.26 TRINITY_DN6429_c0_g2_i1:570-1628(+)